MGTVATLTTCCVVSLWGPSLCLARPLGVARGWGEWLAEILMRVGLGFTWDSFRPGKGLMSSTLVGGFQVDFGSVLVGLRLCAACFCSSFWAALGMWLLEFLG